MRSAGAIGTDAAGDMLLALLERDGVDTALLVRRDDVQTSASVLPIRPSGERPAFHVVGANGTFAPDDLPAAEIEAATHLHLGGPEFMGGEAAARCSRAPASTVWSHPRTCSRPASRACSTGSAPRSRSSTISCRTTTRCSAFTGADELEAGCRALLDRGVGCVAATCGADGVLRRRRGRRRAGPRLRGGGRGHHRLRRRVLGRLPARAQPRRDRRGRARLGCAAAAMVAQGLGTDHGDYDLAAVEELAG